MPRAQSILWCAWSGLRGSCGIVLCVCVCHAAVTVDPMPCGNVTVYCPAGSESPTWAPLGTYTTAGAGVATNATDIMSQALDCPAGHYCVDGVQRACPAGTFLGTTRRSNVSDCRTCTAGGYCPAGAAAPTPCGNDTVYCPTTSTQPLVAGLGYYTEGVPGARIGRVPCEPGSFCPGDGRAYPCPAGSFGNVSGLTNATCSGRCGDGVLCANQSTAAVGVPCPTGSFCVAGLQYPCPAGTFNPSRGATNATAQCLPCPADTYNPSLGSSASADCLACPANEGSGAGASVCWPGVVGT
jgi:hypothetical protein